MKESPVSGGEGVLASCCPYCHSAAIRLRYGQHYHKMNPAYGPFDFFVCEACGGGFNNPMPSNEQLMSFYSSYSNGMPEEYRSAMLEYEDSSWHSQIARNLIDLAGKHGLQPAFTWLDVGSGAGEIARKLSKLTPASRGTCIDLHPAPESMHESQIRWLQYDINADFSSDIAEKFQLVYASAVLEHVVDPKKFLTNCLKLTEPGGVLYFFCPDYSSLASRVMGQKWPYYLPGEHVTLPTKKSVRACLDAISRSGEVGEISFRVGGKRVSYSVQYMLFALNLRRLGKMLPFNFSLQFPTGALEAVIVRL